MVLVNDAGILGVKLVQGLDCTDIDELLADCQQPFEDSMLYSAGADAKFVDKSTRLSKYRAIVDARLFDATAAMLSQISAADAEYDYTLVRSDVTQIVYEAGGFFKRHADFLSLVTNFVEEQTLLVCITPPEAALNTLGGATTIHAYGKSFDFAATTTPGHALLFRKDLDHEGQVVTGGEKHILSVNVWAHRKKSGQTLLITFPHETEECPGQSGGAALLAAANAKAYAMSADDARGMLAGKVEWANRAADEAGSRRPSVITYECADASYTQFGTIFRILCRMHVNASELVQHKATLDFFLPAMRLQDVLVDMASTPVPPAQPLAAQSEAVFEPGRRVIIRTPPEHRIDLKDSEGVVCGARFEEGGVGAYPVLPDGDSKEAVLLPHAALEAKFDDLAAAAKKAAEAGVVSGGNYEARETDAEVICCESAERTQVLVDLVRTLDLPYVSFKLIFVEGVLIARQEADFQMCKVPMTAAWCSVGDYDNVFAFRRLAPQSPHVDHLQLPLALHDFDNLFDEYSSELDEDELAPGLVVLANHLPREQSGGDASDDDESNGERLPPALQLGLRVALPPDGAEAAMHRLLFEREAPHIHHVPVHYLPGLPPTYVPPKAVWMVSTGECEGRPWRQNCRREDFVPLGEGTQALLEAQFAARDKASRMMVRTSAFCSVVVDPGEQSLSWQVCLNGAFMAYEDAEVQRRLEDAWTRHGFRWEVEITVHGVHYVVQRGKALHDFVQRQKDDKTQTLPVKRVGGPVVVTWTHPNVATAGEAAFTTGVQIGPNAEVHVIKRTRIFGSSPPASPEAAPSIEAPDLHGDSPATKKQRVDESSHPTTNPAAEEDKPPALFHRDEHGKTCFTRDEAEEAQWRIAEMRLEDRVKQCLQRKKFVLPQQSRNMIDGFCNESVYGTLNLLSVTGVVRLSPEKEDESLGSPLSSPLSPEGLKHRAEMERRKYRAEMARRNEMSKAITASFDAWPAPEVRNDKIHTAYAQGEEFAATLPEGKYDEGSGFVWTMEGELWDSARRTLGAALGMDDGSESLFP